MPTILTLAIGHCRFWAFLNCGDRRQERGRGSFREMTPVPFLNSRDPPGLRGQLKSPAFLASG